MNIIGTIIIGFFVGLVARFVRSEDDRMGFLFTTIVAIIGAFVGRFLGQAIGIYSTNEPAGVLGAVLGAIVVLTLLKTTTNKKIMH